MKITTNLTNNISDHFVRIALLVAGFLINIIPLLLFYFLSLFVGLVLPSLYVVAIPIKTVAQTTQSKSIAQI